MLIAQMSDIHAAADNQYLDRFERALLWLSQWSPDVLVLTGDLTDGGWNEGYRKIAALLAHQPYPTLLIPGNSDDSALMRQTWSNAFWRRDSSSSLLHFCYSTQNLDLCGLDSTVSGYAHGSLRDRLSWLDEHLLQSAPKPIMLFVHHHLFPSGIPALDAAMCQDSDDLANLLSKHPGRILAIATGHVHRPAAGTFAGIPTSLCGAICPANPLWFGTPIVPSAIEPSMMMIHRYVDGCLSSHHVAIN